MTSVSCPVRDRINSYCPRPEEDCPRHGICWEGILNHRTQYLLACRKVGADLELVMIGPHENYYRDLKQYLKTR
jgi:hypothetical protein